MRQLPKDARVNCEWFRNELETMPASVARGESVEVLLRGMPEEVREHTAQCGECSAALEDFSETRLLLARTPESAAVAGPWFTRRVMNAIAAQERELEERENGFWTSVRRLAPRLVAFAMLLLMLGGTWAFQVQRTSKSSHPTMKSAEGIFEAVPSPPANDDVVAVMNEESAQ